MASKRRPTGAKASRQDSASPTADAPSGPSHNRIVLAAPDAEAFRLFIVTIGAYISRLDWYRRQMYGVDLDLATIAETVGLAALEPRWRDPIFRDRFSTYDTVVGVENQRGINAFSIAQATGIPRETVRRKLKKLVEVGYLTEKTRGRYVTKPGAMQKPSNIAHYGNALRETLNFMNQCLEIGLTRVVESEPG